MTPKRKIYSKKIKFQAALELLSEKHTVTELTQKYGVHHTVLYKWKKDLMEKGPTMFERNMRPKTEEKATEGLQRKIGQLLMENDFLKKSLK